MHPKIIQIYTLSDIENKINVKELRWKLDYIIKHTTVLKTVVRVDILVLFLITAKKLSVFYHWV